MALTSKAFLRYGLEWPTDWDEAQIERYMLQQGGRWQQDGRTLGEGLEFHFKRYWSLLWPDDSQTWWTDLILKEVLANQFTSLVGGASAWKSTSICKIALMDWSLFPGCTTVIMSSTHMEGLRARIYGDTTRCWQLAHELYEWFPGHPIDYKCVIANEDVKEDSARDIRNGIVGVPCFVTGTLVDTPSGPRPIESLKVGEIVFNAVGCGRIVETHHKSVDTIARVTLSDGRTIDCTEEHPFFTQNGWIKAVDMRIYDRVFSVNETMRIVRRTIRQRIPKQEVLFDQMSGPPFTKIMLPMRPKLSTSQTQKHQSPHWKILLRSLCGAVGFTAPGVPQENQNQMPPLQESDFQHPLQSKVLLCEMPESSIDDSVSSMRKGFCFDSGISREAENSFLQFILQMEGDWSGKLKETYQSHSSRNESVEAIPGSNVALSPENRGKKQGRQESLVSTGCCISRNKTGDRGGWWNSPYADDKEEGRNQNFSSQKTWVVGVEILKRPSGIGDHESKGRYKVHNLSVEGHPSYSVNGVVVHNCMSSSGKFIGMGKYAGRKNRRVWCICDEAQFCERSLLDAQNNLVSNGSNLVPGIIRDKDDLENGKPIRGYKCIFVGNTNPTRPDNPLHLVSEPEGGFGSIAEDGKTKVWDCKKLQDHPVKCRCINLDSRDSPNTPYPIDKPRWPALAGPHKVALYTEGSEAYWSQGVGAFKFGLAAFKIITKEICDQFHAFDKLSGEQSWKGTERTKIGMCDASYGGGDRCALGWLEFGMCMDGIVRILLHPYWLIPVRVDPKWPAEDQIATFTKDKMESVSVLPSNFFFDGRGSLALSFSRIWSSQVNSIEFGGRPSERIVVGEWMRDKDGRKREKQAFEHYSKFVSELWWSWLRAVQADQIRGLTLELVLDASPREWAKVAGDKIEIETKRDMKKRTGISCDLADMMVTGIEGARRRGFNILSLKPKDAPEEDEGQKWLADLEQKNYRLIKSKMLANR